MNRIRRIAVISALCLSSGGAMFQLGGCGLGSVLQSVAQINPCGPLLNCDAQVFSFLRSGIDGPGVTDADPFCTFPPFCTPEQDPIFGFVGP